MGKQPGVMLYFDLRPALERLSDGDAGRLLKAVLDYGQFGVVPELDGMAGIAWDFMRPKLDRDRERYEDIKRKRSEAAASRWANYHANASGAMQTMPTTTPTTKTTSSPITAATTTAAGLRKCGKPNELRFNDLRTAALSRLEALEQEKY